MHETLEWDHEDSRHRGGFGLLGFWTRNTVAVLRSAAREHADGAVLDTRLALRRLRARPLRTIIATLSLALGMAALTTVLGVFKAAFMDSLPGLSEPSSLVDVKPMSNREDSFELTSFPYFRELRSGKVGLSALAGFHGTRGSLRVVADGEPQVVPLQIVTPDYFSTLGVRLQRGRLFEPASEVEASSATIVTDWLWRNRLGEAPLGTKLWLNNTSHTLIGVTEEGFRGHFKGFNFDVFLPTGSAASLGLPMLSDETASWIEMVGRLDSESTFEQAATGLRLEGERLREVFPAARDLDIVVERNSGIDSDLRGGALLLLVTLLAVSGFVLVIACLNVACMMMGDLSWRRQELAVRRALGAGPSTLLRQLTIESLLVSLLAGALGVLAAVSSTRWASTALASVDSSMALRVPVDGSLIFWAALIATGSGIFASLAPGLAAARISPMETLRSSTASRSPRGLFFRGLVVAQVLLSFVILASASLFLRALERGATIDPGFDTAQVAITQLDPRLIGLDEARSRALILEAREAISRLPEVRSAALTNRVPLSLGARFFPHTIELTIPGLLGPTIPGRVAPTIAGRQTPPGEAGFLIEHALVTSSYFDTLRIPIVRGRTFNGADREGTRRVAVVNTEFARQYFDGPAIGRIVRRGEEEIEIVGVAALSRYRVLDEDPVPYIYLSWEQAPATRAALLLAAQSISAASPRVRTEMRVLSPALPLPEIRLLQDQLATAFLPQRIAALASGSLGAVGLLLCALGLYGVLGTWVSRRSHEIGLRVSLGATPRDVWRLVLRQGLGLAVIGIVLGVPLTIAGATLFSSFLLDVGRTDPTAYLGVTALLLATTVAASVVPGWRAAHADPLKALRDA